MALPPIPEFPKFKPQSALPRGREVEVQGVYGAQLTGTGYPYYSWVPAHRKCVFTLHPRKPNVAIVEDESNRHLVFPPENEDLLDRILAGELPYNEALKSISEGFFDAESNENRIRVHDGRHWVRYKGSYWVQFNWKTKTQAYPGTKKPRFTDGQMEAVLDDLVERGGRVESAMRRLGNNGYIAGDQEYFWTADGKRYRNRNGHWMPERPAGTKPGVAADIGIPLEELEEKYPFRYEVRHMRTWAGPIGEDITKLDRRRLPPYPVRSRPGNRGSKPTRDGKRKRDEEDSTAQSGKDGTNPPPPKKNKSGNNLTGSGGGKTSGTTGTGGNSGVAPGTMTTRSKTRKNTGK